MVKIPESGGVKPVQPVEKSRNESKKPKLPQEAVGEITDTAELSEEAKNILDKNN